MGLLLGLAARRSPSLEYTTNLLFELAMTSICIFAIIFEQIDPLTFFANEDEEYVEVGKGKRIVTEVTPDVYIVWLLLIIRFTFDGIFAVFLIHGARKGRAGPMEYWMNWTSFWLIVVLISIMVSCLSSGNNDIKIILIVLTGWWVLSAFALKVVCSYKMEVVNGQKIKSGELSGKC